MLVAIAKSLSKLETLLLLSFRLWQRVEVFVHHIVEKECWADWAHQQLHQKNKSIVEASNVTKGLPKVVACSAHPQNFLIKEEHDLLVVLVQPIVQLKALKLYALHA